MSHKRREAYAARNDKEAVSEQKKAKLRRELKEHISFVCDYPVLSADWMALADSFRQVSVVACAELRVPVQGGGGRSEKEEVGAAAARPLAAEGKDRAAGTLWDQQREEMAVRILLEEGKLNLAMRLLHILCEATRRPTWDEDQRRAADELGRPVEEVHAAVRHFEVGLGTLLALAYRHVEALQILDVSEMLTHVAEVAAHAAAADESVEFVGTQPSVIAQYAAALAQRMDDLDEDRVCDVMEETGVVAALVRHHHANYWRLSREAIQGVVLFLAYLAESETFCTEPERFVRDDDTKRQILDLLAWSLGGLMAERLVLRNNVHALNDFVRRWERALGKSAEQPRVPGSGDPPSQGPRDGDDDGGDPAPAAAGEQDGGEPAAEVSASET